MPSGNAKGGPPSPPPKGKPLVPPGLNQAPVAHDDKFTLNEDTSVSGNLLADNGFGADTDPNAGDVLSVQAGTYSTAQGGTIVIQADGHFVYAPPANFNGTDSFIYSVRDAAGLSAAATASFTVNAVNDSPVAQNGSAGGIEDTAINAVLAATDVDSAGLTFSRVTNAAHGDVTVNPNGTFTYTPNPDFNGSDSFTFRASDGSTESNIATFKLTINPVNDAPVAQNGTASGNEDTAINGTLAATDVDGPSLAFSRVTNAAHGNVTVNPNGTFSYTPNPDFNGTDSFTFRANDGSLDSNIKTVALTINPVNDVPVAENGSASGNEDTPIAGTATAIDIDSDGLTYMLSGTNGGAQHGTVSMDAAGHFTYMPATNFNGSDSFSFKASDGTLDSNVATVSLTVNAANDAPTIPLNEKIQNRLITENSPGQHTVQGVVHFSDPDIGDRPNATVTSRILTSLDHATLQLITVGGPHNGEVITQFDGSVIDALSVQARNALRGFTIHSDANNTNDGAINWSYSVDDQALQFLGQGGSATLTATIEVKDESEAVDTAQVRVRLEGQNDAPVFKLDGNWGFNPFDGVANYTFMFGGPDRMFMPSSLPAPDAYMAQVNGNNLHFEGFFYFTDPDIFDLHTVEAHPLSPLIPPWGSSSVEIAVTGTNINAIPRYSGQLTGDSIVDGLGIVHFTYDAAIPAGGFLDPFRITLHDFFGGQSQLDVFIGVPPPLVTPPPIPLIVPPPEFMV